MVYVSRCHDHVPDLRNYFVKCDLRRVIGGGESLSWVCELCSSVNDDNSKECFVCGEKRSKESLRMESAKKHSVVASLWGKRITLSAKIMFWVSLFVFVGVYATVLIAKGKNGEFGDVLVSMDSVFAGIYEGFTRLFTVNGAEMLRRVKSSALFDLGGNAALIWERWSVNFAGAVEGGLLAYLAGIKATFKDVGVAAERILQGTSAKLVRVGDTLASQWQHLTERFAVVAEAIKNMIRTVKEKF